MGIEDDRNMKNGEVVVNSGGLFTNAEEGQVAVSACQREEVSLSIEQWPNL